MTTANQADFTQPYFYLQSDKVKVQGDFLWQLVPKPVCQANTCIPSINRLVTVVDYRRFNDHLFVYLSDAANLAYVKRLLIGK